MCPFHGKKYNDSAHVQVLSMALIVYVAMAFLRVCTARHSTASTFLKQGSREASNGAVTRDKTAL